MSAAVSPARYQERLEQVRAAVAGSGVAAILVGVGPDLEWLAGFPAIGLERLNLLVVTSNGRPIFLGPRLEAAAAAHAPGLASGGVELRTWEEGEDPFALVPELLSASGVIEEAGAPGGRLLVSDGLRAAFVLGLQRAIPNADWGLSSALLAPLRRVKDAEEIALLGSAAAAADRVVQAVAHGQLVGRTEAAVAAEVRQRLVDEGHDTAEFSIVAAGPHSASPHHEPGDRIIAAGEALLLDIGGRRAGYCSDTTRTFWIAADDGSPPDPGFEEIHELTVRAQAAGRAAVRPGETFHAIDAAARDVITAGGYGAAFFHRTGHGIGLDVHEEPWVISGNHESAVAGDAFSVEPGIYLEGRYGVRIEDVVACTAEGVDSLNRSPRELEVVSGRQS